MFKSIVLPEFPGFYNSVFSSYIDYAIEQASEQEQAYCGVNFIGLSEKITSLFAKAIDVPLLFESLQSPREYNFSTDRIFAKIHLEAIKNMFAATPNTLLEQAVKDKHASYSGFISFYSSDLREWPKNIIEWDHNQLSTLLHAYLSHKGFNCDSIFAEIAETMVSNGNIGEYIIIGGNNALT